MIFAQLWRPDTEGIQEAFQEEATFEPGLRRSGKVASSWLMVGCIYQAWSNRTFVSNKVLKRVPYKRDLCRTWGL